MKGKFFILLSFAVLMACSSPIEKSDLKPKTQSHLKAIRYRDSNQIDSSLKYFNLAKDEYLASKDSLNISKCLVNLAIIASNKGDYFSGQEISLNAITYFHASDSNYRHVIHANYNNLGITNYNLKNYKTAIYFYDKALNLTTKKKDSLLYLNNKAKTYEELKNFNESIRIYSKVVPNVKKGSVEYARSLANLASTKWLQDRNYNAAPELLSALNINKANNELLGQNLCLARLADFYSERDTVLAFKYAEQMYVVAQQTESANDQIEALHKLIWLGDPAKTRGYFSRYKELSDSLQTSRSAAKNQFALIRFNTLNLQKDIAQKDYQIETRELLLIAAGLLFIAGAIIAYLLYKKRKQKIEAKAQNDIRESRLRTSKKVHDVVANGLYRVISELENQKDFNKERILDSIDQLYNKSRDISYEAPIVSEEVFDQKLADLLSSFKKEGLNIQLLGNDAQLWAKVSVMVKNEIEHILQELMVNMDKHSNASDVAIKVARIENQIFISYKDNGIGLPQNAQFGNGLTNTENRINSINGSITFENKVEGGLRIQLSFPIS